MTTYELERLLNEHFGELSVRERRIAIRSAELYRDRMFSHWNELREKAAIAAMPIANNIVDNLYSSDYHGTEVSKLHSIERFTQECVAIADALIEELKKEK